MRKITGMGMAIILIFTLFAAACGSTPTDNGDPASATTPPTTAGDTASTSNTTDTAPPASTVKDSIVTALATDITSFNPKTTTTSNDEVIHRQIYDPLLYIKDDKSLELGLAESYQVNDDSTVFTFKIRDGVKFHNGDILRPSDVVFTFNSYMDSPFFYTYVSGIEKIEEVENHSVQITMKAPDAAFLQYMMFFGILNEKVVTEAGDSYDDNPVGTGPYQYVSYERANEIKLTRFDDHYRGPSRIKDLTFRIIGDQNTQTISLQAGDLDFSGFSMASYENVANDPNLKIVQREQGAIMMTLLNHTKPPFDNKLVRQAVCYAIDREFIIDAFSNGFGTPATNVLPPSAFGYSQDIEMGYIYDVAKAKELIAQAGLTVPMDIGAIIVPEVYKLRAEIMQQSLADIGLNATVEVMEGTKYSEDIASGNYTIATRDMGTTGDADFHSLILHSANIGGLNWAQYSNPEVDQLFAEGKAESDPAERLKIYTQLFQIAGDEVAYVPEYYPENMIAMDNNLNIDPNCRVGMYLYDMFWSE